MDKDHCEERPEDIVSIPLQSAQPLKEGVITTAMMQRMLARGGEFAFRVEGGGVRFFERPAGSAGVAPAAIV